MGGSGRVIHTVNPRLHPDQIAWIVNHAEDEVLCFDMSFLPIVQAVHGRCPTVRQWVALCDADKLPADSGIPGLVSYEDWIAAAPTSYTWPQFDENTACGMCYTSGTTGNPKAVLYSHRSTTLHAYGASLPDVMDISSRDVVLPVVPMFHVNAWGLPFSGPLNGAKLVFPGPGLDGKSVYELIEGEKVTFAAGVPTVWQMLLNHVQSQGLKFSTFKRTVLVPKAMLAPLMTFVIIYFLWVIAAMIGYVMYQNHAEFGIEPDKAPEAEGGSTVQIDPQAAEAKRRDAAVAQLVQNGDMQAAQDEAREWQRLNDDNVADQRRYHRVLKLTDKTAELARHGPFPSSRHRLRSAASRSLPAC